MQRSTRIIIIGLVVVGFVLYAFNFGNPLFWDDDDWIIDNPAVHGLSWENTKFLFSHDTLAGIGQSSNYYRPVLMLSFAFNWALGGENPFGYHLVSNGLHIASAVLLFLLLSALLRAYKLPATSYQLIAALAALFWLIHPLNTEAVTYISGRGDPLSTFLMLSALTLFLIARGHWPTSRKLPFANYYFPLSLLFAVLAILSRETAVLFPGFALITLMSFVYVRDGFFRSLFRSLKAVWPFIVVSGGYMLLRITTLNFENTLNWHRFSNVYSESITIRTWTFLGALFDYVRLAFVPVGLHMERSVPALTSPVLWPVPLMLFLLVVLLAQIIPQWQKGNRIWFFGAAWFFLALAPASGIAVPINALIYEHWLYLPLVGVATIFAFYAVRLYEWTKEKGRALTILVLILGIGYTSFLAVQTVRRNMLWGNTEKFYLHILNYEPENVRILNNLANLYAGEQQPDKAEEYWRLAVEADPTQPAPYHNLGNLARDRGDIDKAENLYLLAISRRETFHYAYRNLVTIYLEQQRFHDAAILLLKLTELQPTDPSIYFVLAQLYHAKFDDDLARMALERGMPYVRSPEQAQAYEELIQKLQ